MISSFRRRAQPRIDAVTSPPFSAGTICSPRRISALLRDPAPPAAGPPSPPPSARRGDADAVRQTTTPCHGGRHGKYAPSSAATVCITNWPLRGRMATRLPAISSTDRRNCPRIDDQPGANSPRVARAPVTVTAAADLAPRAACAILDGLQEIGKGRTTDRSGSPATWKAARARLPLPVPPCEACLVECLILSRHCDRVLHHAGAPSCSSFQAMTRAPQRPEAG